jgi:Helix-turn-helix domain
MIKAYRFKLEPNRKQRYALARTLDVCRELYNDVAFTIDFFQNRLERH